MTTLSWRYDLIGMRHSSSPGLTSTAQVSAPSLGRALSRECPRDVILAGVAGVDADAAMQHLRKTAMTVLVYKSTAPRLPLCHDLIGVQSRFVAERAGGACAEERCLYLCPEAPAFRSRNAVSASPLSFRALSELRCGRLNRGVHLRYCQLVLGVFKPTRFSLAKHRLGLAAQPQSAERTTMRPPESRYAPEVLLARAGRIRTDSILARETPSRPRRSTSALDEVRCGRLNRGVHLRCYWLVLGGFSNKD